jgi:hypothetical protein
MAIKMLLHADIDAWSRNLEKDQVRDSFCDISGLMAAEMEFLRSVEGSSKRNKKKKKRLWR